MDILAGLLSDKKLVNHFWHTGTTTPIWKDQNDRFEIIHPEDSAVPEDDAGTMVWTSDNFFHAWICYKWNIDNGYESVILWDLHADQWANQYCYCVWSNAESLK
jgi:hypothetical protein